MQIFIRAPRQGLTLAASQEQERPSAPQERRQPQTKTIHKKHQSPSILQVTALGLCQVWSLQSTSALG